MAAEARAIEFAGTERAEVLGEMRTLAADRAGWVNLSPHIDPDQMPPRGGNPGVFSSRGPLVPLATWVPGPAGGRKAAPSSIGLQHPIGTKAVPTLRELGLVAPDGYRVVADHPRRGLVLEASEPGDVEAVLDFMIRATGGTCPLEFDGRWVAGIVRR